MNAPSSQPDGIGAGNIIRRKADGSLEYCLDEVTAEEPMEIRVGDKTLAVTMRTPGQDEELAAGFLVSEGIVRTPPQLEEVKHSEWPGSEGNVVVVRLEKSVPLRLQSVQRFGTISTSCGICGKNSIAAIHQQFPPIVLDSGTRIPSNILLALPERLRKEQGNFARTGGIHAAAIFDLDGHLIVLREDIGRHNAVDKALGRAFLDGLFPLSQHLLLVSGRASFEIVQKALSAAIPIIASVSAPSTLAVNFARESNQTLVGFLRPPVFNVYAHAERIIFHPQRLADGL